MLGEQYGKGLTFLQTLGKAIAQEPPSRGSLPVCQDWVEEDSLAYRRGVGGASPLAFSLRHTKENKWHKVPLCG